MNRKQLELRKSEYNDGITIVPENEKAYDYMEAENPPIYPF